MIAWRNADSRYPFLWEEGVGSQPAARWHAEGEGPVQYLSDTPDGAWAEFLRHEDIRDPEELSYVRRSLWAVDIGSEHLASAELPAETLTGDAGSYSACREEARRLRSAGSSGLMARSAALMPGAAGGWRVDAGLQPGAERDGQTIVLFGGRPDLTGWRAVFEGRPDVTLLAAVRFLSPG